MSVVLHAFYFPTRIDLKKVRGMFAGRCPKLSNPLQVSLDSGSRACVTSFGAVVFWPYEQASASAFLSELEPFIAPHSAVSRVSDEVEIVTNADESEVLFDEIRLDSEPSFDQIGIISLFLAQSVALNYLEIEVDKALDRIEKQIIGFRKSGRLAISNKSAFKNIGFAMDIRHRVLTGLSLFDKPEAAWESEDIEALYDALYIHFDIEDRHRTISRKLTFISDNTSFLYEFLSTRKSHQLEWIIIILIAIEIVMFLFSEFLLR
jgi:uncharacterized Rmd1/YagE family protein